MALFSRKKDNLKSFVTRVINRREISNEILEERTRELNSFYEEKNIQKNYNFFVSFDETDSSLKPVNTDPIPVIRPWHVKSITPPTYVIKKEPVVYGPLARSFPVADISDGLQYTIVFEEDSKGTIAYLINWFQRRVVTKDGFHQHPEDVKIDGINVRITDDVGADILRMVFFGNFILTADPATMDYADGTQTFYSVTFGCDFFDYEFNKTEVVDPIPNSFIKKLGLGIF